MAEGRSAEAANIDFDAWRANIRRDALSNHHYSMARAIAREGNRPSAIERLRLALAADDRMVAAHAELAALLREEGREPDALAAEAEAAAIDTDWRARAALQRGRELMAVNRHDEALAALSIAESCPALRVPAGAEIANIHFARALRCHSAGDLDGTFAAMLEAMAHDSENPTLLHHISHRYFAAGDLDTASACAIKATRLTTDGHLVDYMRLAVEFLQVQERWDTIIELTAEMAARNPLEAESHVLMAQALLAAGRGDQALRVMRIGLALAPELPGLWVPCIIHLQDTGQDAASERLLRRLSACYPGHQALRGLLTALLCGTGRHAEAVVVAKARPVGTGANPLLAIPLAMALNGSGHAAAAQALLRDAVSKIAPLNWWPKYILGHLHARHAAALVPLYEAANLPLPQ